MKRIFLFLFAVQCGMLGFTQNTGKITISVGQTDSTLVSYETENNKCIVVTLNKDTNDFHFLGQIELPSTKKSLSLFSEYSSPAGLTRYYYFDPQNQMLYTTDFFEETEFAQVFSINIYEKIIYYVSTKSKICGAILTKKIFLEKCGYKSYNKATFKPVKNIIINYPPR